MNPIDLFSKRGTPLPDVYVYDKLPTELRNQVVHLLQNIMERTHGWHEIWPRLARELACEHGLLSLPTQQARSRYDALYDRHNDASACMNYFLITDHVPRALDVIELAMRELELIFERSPSYYKGSANDFIAVLNHRFREHGCGFEYAAGKIVRIDSQLLHAEAVRPAIAFLLDPDFAGPNQEFLSAHEHLRHDRIEEAVTDACKAFESTMKTICDLRSWYYDPKDTADKLIQVLINNALVPKYSEEQLQNVRKCLVGLATIRNKNAGHGAGSQPRDVPQHYAAYAMHLAATNIVFLVECHKTLPQPTRA